MYRSSNKYWDISAPIAGILYTLSFSPFDHVFLAIPALALLFAGWQQCSAKRAALRGYLFGLSSFGSGVSWVYFSMHDAGGAGVFESSLLTGLFAGFWAVFPALAGLLAVPARYADRLVSMPLVWILVDYIRGYWVLNGFPWLQIAYTQMESPLSGFIPVFGAYGTGLIAALSASALIEICRLLQPSLARLPIPGLAIHPIPCTGTHSIKSFFPVAAIAALWFAGSLLSRIDWTYEAGPALKVALIQGNIAQDQKWRPENKINTMLKYKAMTEQHWDADVIVWPETAIPAYLDQIENFFLAPIANEARQSATDMIVSVPVQDSEKNENYNAVITMGKDRGIYKKTHLLPFGEYLPWQPLSGFVLDLIHIKLGNFTPGAFNQPLLRAGGYPFVTLICYEDVFGGLTIRGLPDAAYLVNVTNDGWFGNSIEPHQHMQMARMRALESGRYLLRSTNTGTTAIVSPKGGIVEQAPLFEDATLTGTITPMGGMTPYGLLGDQAVIAAILMWLSALLVLKKPEKNGRE